MSDFVYIRVPRTLLDASDQAEDLLQSPRGLLFELSITLTAHPKMKVAYNADADGARVVEESYLSELEANRR